MAEEEVLRKIYEKKITDKRCDTAQDNVKSVECRSPQSLHCCFGVAFSQLRRKMGWLVGWPPVVEVREGGGAVAAANRPSRTNLL